MYRPIESSLSMCSCFGLILISLILGEGDFLRCQVKINACRPGHYISVWCAPVLAVLTVMHVFCLLPDYWGCRMQDQRGRLYILNMDQNDSLLIASIDTMTTGHRAKSAKYFVCECI